MIKGLKHYINNLLADPIAVGDTVYYQGFKLEVVEVDGVMVTAVTLGNSEQESSYYTDDYRMFVKL